MTLKLADAGLLIALVASVTLNIVQMRTINRLHAVDAVAVGVRIPSLSVADLEGRRADLPLAGALPTVLYVFSPQCGWCDANRAGIEALVRQVRGRYRVVGVSLTDRDLETSLRARPLPMPIYHSPTAEAVTAFRLETTPQTIVLSPDGRVERVWQGAYAGRTHAAIQSFFGVNLPALSASGSGNRGESVAEARAGLR
jgi:peroxiredoxin